MEQGPKVLVQDLAGIHNGADHHNQHPADLNDDERNLYPAHRADVQRGDKGKHDQRGGRQQNLAQVDVVPRDAVAEAELEQVIRDSPRQGLKRRGVERDDADIAEAQKPGADKTMQLAEGFLGIHKL